MKDILDVMLDEEIRTEIGELSSMESGSEEQSEAIENLTKLYRLKIDAEKASAESKWRRIETFTKVGIAAAELVVPIAFYNIWMNRGFEFEENGTIASWTFKNLIKCFTPTRRK